MAKNNTKKITIADVANEAGVSSATVSLVLNKKSQSGISKATSDRVMQTAVKLGYLQSTDINTSSQNLEIAVMLPDLINPCFSRFLSQVSDYAYNSNVHLDFCSTGGSPEVEREYLLRMIERGVSGILYVYSPSCEDFLKRNIRKIPTVIVGDCAQRSFLANISTDNYEAGHMLADYLFNLGHHHVAYITQPVNAVSQLRSRRLLGLSEGFSSHGCADTFHVFEQIDMVPTSNGTAPEVLIGQNKTEEILRSHPEVTAIVTMGDMIAIGVYNILHREGIKIPDDISVASFDDIEFARYISPSLTTVDARLQLRCKFAFDYLMQIINEGPDDTSEPLFVSYRSTLRERKSTGPARNGKLPFLSFLD